VALNDAAEIGQQNLTVQDAIDGTWVPVTDETPATETVDVETGEIVGE